LRQERIRVGTWGDCADAHRDLLRPFRRVAFNLAPSLNKQVPLRREVVGPACPRMPPVPSIGFSSAVMTMSSMTLLLKRTFGRSPEM
jgi:hypothetical protein